ncbi:VWA domain-containing protein [Pikeienuella piscinae]|uniref:VWA domain-containing protein n=1 Tax=Pikeienuella piscinae TaxID=2748098 RepID=A0A7L5BXA6_9RHOB|nr:VWA domain-containing protein [Pikeienuella piscinae]QIE56362.1 VWA domain-containing protein [Pikeienuella piscinae]
MSEARYADLPIRSDGKLAANIAHFARALRRAGMPVGPGRILSAVQAVEAAGFSSRDDFYWTLHACFVSRPEHRELFGQTFRLFWRDPQFLEHMMSMLMPQMRGTQEEHKPDAAEKRAAEALLDDAERPDAPEPEGEKEEIEIDAALTFSAEEKLKRQDFEQMTLAEQAEALRAIARLELPLKPIASRRTRTSMRGRMIDARRTLRAAMRSGGEIRSLAMRERRERPPALIALCDISGSMAGYSRMLMHFLHAASNAKGAGWSDVHSFTFGTRLTNITRHLKLRDVDSALKRAGAEAEDWEGGTRIGACLRRFNRDWSRRVLGQGAVVILITDGLDRDDPIVLGHEMERLRLSCRKLIWLNPLLRWDGFAPRARGVRAMLPRVDSFRAAHSVASLEALAAALSRPDDAGDKARLIRMMAESSPVAEQKQAAAPAAPSVSDPLRG